MARARTAADEGDSGGSSSEIAYVDRETHWVTVDNRLGDERVQYLPKTQRDVPLPEAEQKKLAERVEAENEAEQVRKEALEAQYEAPPVASGEILIGTRGEEA